MIYYYADTEPDVEFVWLARPGHEEPVQIDRCNGGWIGEDELDRFHTWPELLALGRVSDDEHR